MENYLNSTDDALVKNLDFSLPSSTNYLTDRRSVLYQPVGASNVSHNTNRFIKFKLTGDNWLDPASVRIQYTLKNNSNATPLVLLSPALPTNFFRRLRILSNQPIEDLDYYNRMCVMMNVLKPTDARISESMEHFGINDKLSTDKPNEDAYPSTASVDFNSMNYNIRIEPNGSRTVLFSPLCGLFSQTNYIPLRYMPLEIELELCTSRDDPLVSGGAGFSTDYQLENIQLHCDLLTLDSSIDNEFSDHILSGKPLTLHLNTFYHHFSQITNTDRPVLTFARAFTRLKRAYISFYKRLKTVVVAAGVPRLDDAEPLSNRLKEMNLFWHPQLLGIDNTVDSTNLQDPNFPTYDLRADNEIESQVQIGHKLIPEQYMRHSTTQLYHLKKCLNVHHNATTYALGMTPQEYRSHKHIQAFDFQKAPTFGSGISTKQGDLLTVKLQNVVSKFRNAPLANGYADAMYTLLEYDMIIDISDSGISVLD